jgi:hypothetical protein
MITAWRSRCRCRPGPAGPLDDQAGELGHRRSVGVQDIRRPSVVAPKPPSLYQGSSHLVIDLGSDLSGANPPLELVVGGLEYDSFDGGAGDGPLDPTSVGVRVQKDSRHDQSPVAESRRVRPECSEVCSVEPLSFLARQRPDSVEFVAVQQNVRTTGSAQLGTDLPAEGALADSRRTGEQKDLNA